MMRWLSQRNLVGLCFLPVGMGMLIITAQKDKEVVAVTVADTALAKPERLAVTRTELAVTSKGHQCHT